MSRGNLILVGLLCLALPVESHAQEGARTESEEALSQALADIEAGETATAVSRLEALLQGNADDPAMAVLGAIYLETGDAVAAAARLKPLAEGQNPDPAVLYNYGRAAAARRRGCQEESGGDPVGGSSRRSPPLEHGSTQA